MPLEIQVASWINTLKGAVITVDINMRLTSTEMELLMHQGVINSRDRGRPRIELWVVATFRGSMMRKSQNNNKNKNSERASSEVEGKLENSGCYSIQERVRIEGLTLWDIADMLRWKKRRGLWIWQCGGCRWPCQNNFSGVTGMQVYMWVEDKMWGEGMQTACTDDFGGVLWQRARNPAVGGRVPGSKKRYWIFLYAEKYAEWEMDAARWEVNFYGNKVLE